MPRLKVRQAVTQPLDKPYRFLPLTQGQVAIVDAADFEWLSRFSWSATKNPQTKQWYVRTTIPISRLLLGPGLSETVDHINGNTLDNRRCNLRPATYAQNMQNRKRKNKHGYKGIHWVPYSGYQVRIAVDGERRHFGYFKTAKEAAHAYDEAAKYLHGEFARLNFPE